MRLTRFTEQSLRVLTYLAYVNRTRLLTSAELTRNTGSTQHHVSRIIQLLNQENVTTTVRGRLGGITLVKDPAEYRLGDLVRIIVGDQSLFDGDEVVGEHFDGTPLRTFFADGMNSFFETLNKYSLADVAKSPELIATLARIERTSQASQTVRPVPKAVVPVIQLVKPKRKRTKV